MCLSTASRPLFYKHIPTHAQGPLIANALSTAFQFQMAVWRMVGGRMCMPHSNEAFGLVWPGWHSPGHSRNLSQKLRSNVPILFRRWQPLLPSPAHSSQPHPMRTRTTTHWVVAGTSAGLRPVLQHPWMVGVEAPVHLAGLPPSRPVRCPMVVPLSWRLTTLKHPVRAPPIFAAEQGDHDHGNTDDELDLGVEADDEGDGDKGTARRSCGRAPG